MASEEVTSRFLASARYGDAEDLQQVMDAHALHQDAIVNFVQQATGNTPLHMACANGHLNCVEMLLAHGARHVPNANGNYPLHWAVQNKHLEIVKRLLAAFEDIDVLAQNGFGRGCVTEAFQCEDTEILATLLEHKSASEERLAAGSGMDNASIREEEVDEDQEEEHNEQENAGKSSQPRILQQTTLEFNFDSSLKPTLKARELALDWDKDVFSNKAEEDTTGVSIWSASLILSRWVLALASEFADKQVCELGAGCGVSGLACYLYTKANRVVLTDLFEHTLRNLRHNVALNKPTNTPIAEPKLDEDKGCDVCGVVQKFSPENPEGKLMLCSACRGAQYCSRACQKQAWKSHKVQCKLLRKQAAEAQSAASKTVEVQALDWAKASNWQKPHEFDILMGSDLVYHQEIVPILVNAIDQLVHRQHGQFLHVASQQRASLVEFKQAMEARGFDCEVSIVPDSFKINPLVKTSESDAAELFDLHFNEMQETYCMYRFSRKPSQ